MCRGQKQSQKVRYLIRRRVRSRGGRVRKGPFRNPEPKVDDDNLDAIFDFAGHKIVLMSFGKSGSYRLRVLACTGGTMMI